MKQKIYNTVIENYEIEIEFNDDKSVNIKVEEIDYYNYSLIVDCNFEDKKTLLKIFKHIIKKLEGKKKKNVRKRE